MTRQFCRRCHTWFIAWTSSCPRCGATSYNPNDVREGYCGRCHWWTGDPVLGEHCPEPDLGSIKVYASTYKRPYEGITSVEMVLNWRPHDNRVAISRTDLQRLARAAGVESFNERKGYV